MGLWPFGSFQTAATLGSGTKVTTGYTDAEDSICPKGWRMPSFSGDYDNPGSNSWWNLINIVYGIPTSSGTYGANRLGHWPLNLMPTGFYMRGGAPGGYIDGRTLYSEWWTITGDREYGVKIALYKQPNDYPYGRPSGAYRGNGLAIRCVVRS